MICLPIIIKDLGTTEEQLEDIDMENMMMKITSTLMDQANIVIMMMDTTIIIAQQLVVEMLTDMRENKTKTPDMLETFCIAILMEQALKLIISTTEKMGQPGQMVNISREQTHLGEKKMTADSTEIRITLVKDTNTKIAMVSSAGEETKKINTSTQIKITITLKIVLTSTTKTMKVTKTKKNVLQEMHFSDEREESKRNLIDKNENIAISMMTAQRQQVIELGQEDQRENQLTNAHTLMTNSPMGMLMIKMMMIEKVIMKIKKEVIGMMRI
jgi:hypothetical protein